MPYSLTKQVGAGVDITGQINCVSCLKREKGAITPVLEGGGSTIDGRQQRIDVFQSYRGRWRRMALRKRPQQ